MSFDGQYCMAECAAEHCPRNKVNIPPDITHALPMEDFSRGCPHFTSHGDAGDIESFVVDCDFTDD